MMRARHQRGDSVLVLVCGGSQLSSHGTALLTSHLRLTKFFTEATAVSLQFYSLDRSRNNCETPLILSAIVASVANAVANVCQDT